MQIQALYGAAPVNNPGNGFGMPPAFFPITLSEDVFSRLRAVDQLIQSNNELDRKVQTLDVRAASIEASCGSALENAKSDILALLDMFRKLSAVCITIDGETRTLGEWAESVEKLSVALDPVPEPVDDLPF